MSHQGQAPRRRIRLVGGVGGGGSGNGGGNSDDDSGNGGGDGDGDGDGNMMWWVVGRSTPSHLPFSEVL